MCLSLDRRFRSVTVILMCFTADRAVGTVAREPMSITTDS